MNERETFSPVNIAIVCNSIAGVGRAVLVSKKIVASLEQKKIAHTLYTDQWPDHFTGFSDVWIIGGDGTLNYFINKYPEIQLPLTVFRGGTGNDIHWLLYSNLSFEDQLESTFTTSPKAIDAGRCNEKLFINNAGIGFEGAVAESLTGKKKLPGKTSFMLTILKKIFFYRSKIYTVVADEWSGTGKQMMITVSNGQRAGGGFHVAPEAAIDDGLLDIIMVKAISPLMRLRYLPVIEKGKHLHLSFIRYFKTKKIIIESDQLLQSHLDGEYYKAQKMELEILPAKFLFRYKKDF
jgi:diacylglycerol kinase (ATP)